MSKRTNGSVPSPKGYGRTASLAQGLDANFKSKKDKHSVSLLPSNGALGEGADSIPGYYWDEEKYLKDARKTDFDGGRYGLQGFDVDLEQRDIDLLEEKREAELHVAYDDWLTRRFNFSNFMESKWLQRIEPDFFKRRKAYLDDKMKIETFLARMRLYGPSSLEDLKAIASLSRPVLGDSFYQTRYYEDPTDDVTRYKHFSHASAERPATVGNALPNTRRTAGTRAVGKGLIGGPIYRPRINTFDKRFGGEPTRRTAVLSGYPANVRFTGGDTEYIPGAYTHP